MDAAELDAEGLDRRIAAQELAVHLSRCVSVDLEVDMETERIHALAGVRHDTGKRYLCSDTRRSLRHDLAVLDNLAEGADFVLGHNLINFDLPHLRAADPGLRILRMLAVDTLWLNPLAFPRQPYHHLVKHYKEGDLKRHTRNDPELDAQLALDAFKNQQEALLDTEPRLLAAWHWLCSGDGNEGFTLVFEALRGSVTPSAVEARRAIEALLEGITCRTQAHEAVEAAEDHGWSLAYALAWLSVAPRPANDESASESGFSVMPPWVRHQFPEAGRLIRRLRDTACESNHCAWCREHHDAQRELKRFFGFDEFRSQPEDAEGRSLQQTITQDAMSGRHVLGILPTGTGKSVCYQVPALSRHDKTGAVTVVISPLVALMADQVAGLEAHGITSCVTVNGMLSMPERSEALTKLRLGDAAMVLISPEQLRSQALRRALDQREIGAWVLDEAHCLSKWGHDFRPDYRYVGRFIREQAENAGSSAPPPILCLTATAKPEVKEEIIDYFWQTLGIEMRVRDGGSRRSNLAFVVVETTEANKLNDIRISLERHLGAETAGGAIVYCATRRRTEEVAQFLRDTGMEAERFHAGLKPEEKKQIQQRFKEGDLGVLAATNAFGMGIDKPDVRLVIHADIPSSLENYLQEAGRAGRDGDEAHCVLLYTKDDVERQFSMSARSRLTKHEIHTVLRALKRLSRRYRKYGDQEPLIATAGEILSADEDKAFRRDTATDDTRVRTALLWLEESRLLTRDENRVRIFPSSLRVGSVEDAERRLQKAVSDEDYRFQLTGIVRRLLEAAPDEGISTDELMSYTGLSSEGVRVALHDLERFGIAGNDVALTAFVHVGAPRPSRKRFGEAQELEMSLLEQMREKAPDMALEESAPLNLRLAAQQLSDSLDRRVLPGQVTRILRSVADDGRGEDSGGGSLALRKRDAESVNVTLKREWGSVARMAQRRRDAAGRLLEHLLDCLPRGVRGGDLLAETTLGELQKALAADAQLTEQTTDARKLLERSLLWLHEQDVIRLNKGLAVFRPAMTIRLDSTKRSFTKEDFTALQLHYNSTVRQIHIMAEYAQQGLASLADAVRLSLDYFVLGEAEFLRRWLPDSELSRQTTPESWHKIVESLRNPAQRRLVADDRENANVLVLAGPGSGKTRVLVHRIAYLIRVRREDPRSILALAYNRHAAVEIRRRLTELIGDDARGVMVLTCHAMAMRLVGASFSGQAERLHQKELQEQLDRVIKEAVALLRGERLESDDTEEAEEAEEARDRLLAGFRWILVDEYQDVGLDEYELIDALAGRTISDENAKLNLFAVGDDDQNIYSFNGSSVAYIRRFEQDYKAKPAYLTDNYRSTRHIIDASNALIAPALERLKKDNPIHVNQARLKEPAGGEWTARDPVAQGRVQIMPVESHSIAQAQAALCELERLKGLAGAWDWSDCAVIARKWKCLEPLRSLCEFHGIPCQTAADSDVPVWQTRETQALLDWIEGRDNKHINNAEICEWLNRQRPGPWIELLKEAAEEHADEAGDSKWPVESFREWLAEWAREARRRQRGLLLTTAHSAKGLEFDHVVVLDGGWKRGKSAEDLDAQRRLYYVAMTRARRTLTLMCMNRQGRHPLHATREFAEHLPSVLRREPPKLVALPPEAARQYCVLTLGDVYLSYAGNQPPNHSLHRALAALAAGDPLQVRTDTQPWDMCDGRGMTVGRLATKFEPPQGQRLVSAKVHAVVVRRRDQSSPEYQEGHKCDRWETVIPELIFEPL